MSPTRRSPSNGPLSSTKMQGGRKCGRDEFEGNFGAGELGDWADQILGGVGSEAMGGALSPLGAMWAPVWREGERTYFGLNAVIVLSLRLNVSLKQRQEWISSDLFHKILPTAV